MSFGPGFRMPWSDRYLTYSNTSGPTNKLVFSRSSLVAGIRFRRLRREFVRSFTVLSSFPSRCSIASPQRLHPVLEIFLPVSGRLSDHDRVHGEYVSFTTTSEPSLFSDPAERHAKRRRDILVGQKGGISHDLLRPGLRALNKFNHKPRTVGLRRSFA